MLKSVGMRAWLVGAAWALTLGPALAQSNLDAGKSPAQIFSDTCNACHRNPRELKQAGAAFLREHYMTGPREAAAMAAYLGSIGSDPRAVQQRRPPTMGAGQTPPAEARPAQTVPPGAAPGSPATPAAPPAATATAARAAQAGRPGRRPSRRDHR